MPDSLLYHEGNRQLQDAFDSRRISDRLEEKLTRTRLHGRRQGLHRERDLLLLATADADGPPGLLLQGRRAGLRAGHRADELAFPDYDGNGMFKSLGNISVNRNIGLLFIDLHEKPRRLRVNGEAKVSRDDPLLARDSRGAADRARKRARHFPQLPALHPEAAAGRAVQVRAAARQRPRRAGLEGSSPISRTTCTRASPRSAGREGANRMLCHRV